MILAFIAGYVMAIVPAYFVCLALRSDNQKLINEFSIRTNGRKVFQPNVKPETAYNERVPESGEHFGVFTPSMAEEEAESKIEEAVQMSEADMEYLKRAGMIQ